jgi:hypothetical protein
MVQINLPDGLTLDQREEGFRAASDALRSIIAECGGRRPKTIDVTLDGDEWTISVPQPEPNIVRLRRITGYVSYLTSFNAGKRAEERDRVVHAKGGA